MPVTFLPFAQFTPDQGHFRNPGLLKADNVAPMYSSGFLPTPPYTNKSGSVTGGGPLSVNVDTGAGAGGVWEKHGLYGAVVRPYRSATGQFMQWEVFAGDQNGDNTAHAGAGNASLYRWMINAAGDFQGSNVSRAAGGKYLCQKEGWFFVNYGEQVIAVCGWEDVPQIWLSGATAFVSLFAGPSPSEPKAKFCGTILNHVVLAGCKTGATEQPNRVWWSAIDNARFYSDPSTTPGTRSDFQDLNDEFGPVSGFIGASDYAYVFKPLGIYRMDFGGPYQFSFTPFSMNQGTVWPRSIGRLGDRVYFWGPAGPTVIDESMQVRPLGLGVFSRSLLDGSWVLDRSLSPLTKHPSGLLWCAVDADNDLVVWGFNALNKHALDEEYVHHIDTLFVYNARYDRGAIVQNFVTQTKLIEDGSDGILNYTNAVAVLAGDYLPAVGFFVPRYPLHTGFTRWGPLARLHMLFVSRDDVVSAGTLEDEFSHMYVWPGDEKATIPRFTTGYVELSEDGTDVEINAVRPVYSLNDGGRAPTFEVHLSYLRDPGMPAVAAREVHAKVDDRGWIKTRSHGVAPFHQVELRFIGAKDVAEIEGVEVEWQPRGTNR